jgi:hypothetical protein
LQDEVGSSTEIQAKMNVFGDRGQKPLAGEALRNTDDPEHKEKQDPDDGQHFPEQILIHEGVSL